MANNDHLDFDIIVKLELYGHFAATGKPPSVQTIAERVGGSSETVRESYMRLAGRRLLVLEDDGASIRMAPPFSGVPTQHVAEVESKRYYANCAWDVLGVPLALQKPGEIHSRCEHSGERLTLTIDPAKPPESDWLFHCPVPAAHWWDDVVFT